MFHVLWWYFAKKNAAETLHQLSYSKGCCRIIEFSQWPMASQPTSPTVTTARNQAFLNPYIFLKGVRSGGGFGEALMVCWWMSVIPGTATNEDLQCWILPMVMWIQLAGSVSTGCGFRYVVLWCWFFASIWGRLPWHTLTTMSVCFRWVGKNHPDGSG